MVVVAPYRWIAVSLLLGQLTLLGCASDSLVDDRGTRAVIIGIDGADWRIINELAAEGGMPHLSGLQQRGVSGPIATLPDIALSPVIWTSVATGKTTEKHGITWFLVDRPDGTRVPVRSYNRKCKAIWNIMAEHGRRATVVGWWATYPAENVGPGIVVSDALGFHGFGATARDGDDREKIYPAPLFAEVQALVPREQDVTAEFTTRFLHLEPETYRTEMFDPARVSLRDPTNPIHLFQQYAVTAQAYTSIAERLLADDGHDLFLVYYEQVDSLSHLFMKYDPPRLEWVEEAEFERYRDVVRQWYRYQDELLGRLLARIDLNTTAVFVLSDHGFKTGDRRIRSERTVDVRKAHLDHERNGIFVAAGPRIRRGAPIRGASVLDVAPTVLHYLGFPVARDMDGDVLEEIFEPSFREAHSIRHVATYEALPGADNVLALSPKGNESSAEEMDERLSALKTLGYIGGTDAHRGEASRPPSDDAESSPEIHNNLGRVLMGKGALDEAQREFEQALVLDPNNADALLNMGTIRRLMGRQAEAEHYVKRALRVNPDSITALAQLAELSRDAGELEESIRLYREALLIDDSQPFVYLGLGDSLQRARQYEEAERAFETVLELDPDSFEAYYNLGVTHVQQGRLDDAVARFERALELNPNHPNASYAYNNLGDVYLRRGETRRAMDAFRRAVDIAPNHLEPHYNLSSLYLSQGRLDEAIGLLEQASALQPDHEWVHSTLGMTYLQKGRNQDAYRTLLLVQRLYPQNWVAPLGLGLLHAGSGRLDEGRRLMEESFRLGGDAARAEARNYPLARELLGDTK